MAKIYRCSLFSNKCNTILETCINDINTGFLVGNKHELILKTYKNTDELKGINNRIIIVEGLKKYSSMKENSEFENDCFVLITDKYSSKLSAVEDDILFDITDSGISNALKNILIKEYFTVAKSSNDFRADDVVRNSLLLERLKGAREIDEYSLNKRLKIVGLSFEKPYYCVVALMPYLMKKRPESFDEYLTEIKENVRSYYHDNGYECHVVTNEYCQILAINGCNNIRMYKEIDDVTSSMIESLGNKYKIDIYAGIGSEVDSFIKINLSCSEALEALEYKFSLSSNNVVNIKNIESLYDYGADNYQVQIDRIIGCFYDNNLELMEIRVGELVKAIKNNSANNLLSTKNIFIEMTSSVLRRSVEMGYRVIRDDFDIYSTVLNFSTIDEITTWFMNFCRRILASINEEKNSRNNRRLQTVEEYIRNHLGDYNLSVNSVSDYAGLSPSYLSEQFYKSRQMYLSEYITNEKIKASKDYLINTDMKIYEIAERLGFGDSAYFNKVFKKYVGMTPLKYRKENSEQ